MNGGRKPKPPREKKDQRMRLHLSEQDAELVSKLATELNCTAPEVLRRGVERLAKELTEDMLPVTLRLTGDSSVITKKLLAIEAYRCCGNASVAADRAQVSTTTIQAWFASDSVFAERCKAAQGTAVGSVRMKLFEKALAGHTSACFGILNALDPDFGVIRNAMLKRVVKPLLDAVSDAAAQFLTDEQMKIFARDVSTAASQIALTATASSKR